MKNIKGFTILELIVSIGIFSFVCVSVLGLVNMSNRANEKSDNSITASDIASEGIEVVTYMRDNNFLSNRTYTNGILTSDRSFIILFNRTNNSWSIDYGNDNNTETMTSCINSVSNSCNVYKSNSLGYYTQSRSNNNSDLIATNFYRLITVQTGTNYIKVISNVSWKDGANYKNISFEKNLYNWK